jgi:hypothetical protein
MAQDYILRLIEQVAQMLAGILSLRKLGRIAEAAEQIEAACRQHTGLSLDLVRRSAPETILELLKRGGGTQYVRAIILAELLVQDAELSDSAGKTRAAAISRAQAHALLSRSIDHLSSEEQAIYRAKLEMLAAQISSSSPHKQ